MRTAMGLVLALSVTASFHSVAASQTTNTLAAAEAQHLDPQFLPITAEDLRRHLQTARTELDFYNLIRRGHRRQLDSVSIDTLRSLMQAHPKDGIYLGALCFALQTANSQEYASEYDDLLRRAKYDGSYWLPLILEGGSEMFFGRGRTERNGKWVEMDSAKARHGFMLIRKAVDSAPDIAPTHYELAKAYIQLENKWNPETQKYEYVDSYAKLAASELAKASRLEPTMYEVAKNQLWIDLFNTHDKQRALEDKKRVLTEIPSEDVLEKDEKQLLSMAKG
jgi:hypothetical protein